MRKISYYTKVYTDIGDRNPYTNGCTTKCFLNVYQ